MRYCGLRYLCTFGGGTAQRRTLSFFDCLGFAGCKRFVSNRSNIQVRVLPPVQTTVVTQDICGQTLGRFPPGFRFACPASTASRVRSGWPKIDGSIIILSRCPADAFLHFIPCWIDYITKWALILFSKLSAKGEIRHAMRYKNALTFSNARNILLLPAWFVYLFPP